MHTVTQRGVACSQRPDTTHHFLPSQSLLLFIPEKKMGLNFFFGCRGLIGHNAFLEMKRSTRRWQQDEESTVRKNWGHNCWEESFWVWMLVSLYLFLFYKHEGE